MRVATVTSLAVAVVVGLAPAAQACSVDSGGGPIQKIFTGAVDKVKHAFMPDPPTPTGGGGGTPPTNSSTPVTTSTPASSTTSTTFITNNTTNNTTNNITNVTSPSGTQNGTGTTGAGGTSGTGTGVAATTTIAPSVGGGGGGAGGGGGLGGGGFSGSSGVSGPPINPTADLGLPAMNVALGSSGSGGGSGSGAGSDVVVLGETTSAAPTSAVTFAMASDHETPVAPAGVTIVTSLPASERSSGAGSALPIAAIARTALLEKEPALSGDFAFEGAAADGPPLTPRASAMLLSSLGGVAVLGAAWAWRQMV